jgi:3-deoxy-D-manno-octulosonate 8-phosphate phosphatase (KDO 8-P phosphatase)
MNVLNTFGSITTFLFDMDGVITDGRLIVLPGGTMARRVNIKDGYAIQLAVKKGYTVAVISGGTSSEMQERMRKLGVKDFFAGVEDKAAFAQNFLQERKLAQSETLFMGDDIPDHAVMQLVGLPCCPADAVQEIKEIARYISPCAGGEGCVRDVIEKVLKLRNDWSTDTSVKSL